MNVMMGSSLLLNSAGYQISRSVRLRSSASPYFNRNAYPVSGAGTRWTMSKWVKRGTIGAQTDLFSFVSTAGAAQQAGIQFDSNNAIRWWQYAAPSYQFHKVTTAVFRDPSAWYHLLFIYDTTLVTAEDRLQIWVNGVRQTAFSTNTNPSQNLVTYYNNGTLYPYIGAENRNASSALSPFDGYLTEINFIDGQALTPSSFGETNAVTGVWQPIKYTGTYGTNGFYLNFSDNSAATAAAIGKDYSGNGNNWTPNNISLTAGVTYDSMLDVPTLWDDGGNGRGNYAVLNPLSLGSTVTLSNGNLTMTEVGTYATTVSSIAMTSGKWYAEMTAQSNTYAGTVGIAKLGYSRTSRLGFQANTWSYNNDGGLYYNSSTLATVSTYTTNDVVGIAFDADNMTITFYKNGVQQGTQYTAANSGLTAGEFYFATGHINSTSAWNFGQRPFAYTPPTGFKALNTLNLPTPTILKGNQYFDATLWTGDNTARNITNSGAMQPDLVWVKSRSTAGTSHVLIDAVRGANLALQSDLTNAEATFASSVTGFNTDGFALGTSNQVNLSPRTYVGWQWKEGATQGFDIVTYTGTGANRTIAHNLGVAPSMIIVKRRDSGPSSWTVWHSSFSSIEYIYLNLTNAKSSSSGSTVWNSTLPTSSVFSLGTYTDVNANAGTFVAYLFAAVAGYSAFGSYTGNGSADGPFVFTGFRPRFVMWKRTDAVANWFLMDSSRTPANPVNLELYADQSNAEVTFTDCDFLSNGFKLRTSDSSRNASGGTYIYMAFAENPFKNALAR